MYYRPKKYIIGSVTTIASGSDGNTVIASGSYGDTVVMQRIKAALIAVVPNGKGTEYRGTGGGARPIPMEDFEALLKR